MINLNVVLHVFIITEKALDWSGVDMRRSKTSLLKLPNLRAKEDVREKTGECFQDLEERRWKKTTNVPRNQHKIWQAFHLFSFSFTWSLALRHYHPPLSSCAVQKTKHLRRGRSSPYFLPPPPHLFRRQIRRLKVLNMTWNHILIIRYPLSKLNAGLKIDFRETPQVTVRGFEMLFSTIHFCYFSDALRFNPFTAKVLHGLL